MSEAETAGGSEANGAVSRPPEVRDVIAAALVADRAEAQAQLESALAMLEPLTPTTQTPPTPTPTPTPDVLVAAEALRAAAADALETAAEVERIEIRLAGLRPVVQDLLDSAATAADDADAARAEIAPAWRRTAGSLISATGMAIMIASLTWPPWAYLVPTVLVLVMAADLRVTAGAARAASLHAAELMGAAGVASAEGLARARAEGGEREVMVQQRDQARRRAVEAGSRWAELAPGTAPDGVESLIRRLEAPPPPPPPPQAPTPRPLSPQEERTRSLAEALAAEARAEIARIDAALAKLAESDQSAGEREAEEPPAAEQRAAQRRAG